LIIDQEYLFHELAQEYLYKKYKIKKIRNPNEDYHRPSKENASDDRKHTRI
jgi:hypothetical protein